MPHNGSICWPNCFSQNMTNFLDEPIEHVLAIQLCAWGNLYVGIPIPPNFFEVMNAASVATNAFTPAECKDLFNQIMSDRRHNSESDD